MKPSNFESGPVFEGKEPCLTQNIANRSRQTVEANRLGAKVSVSRTVGDADPTKSGKPMALDELLRRLPEAPVSPIYGVGFSQAEQVAREQHPGARESFEDVLRSLGGRRLATGAAVVALMFLLDSVPGGGEKKWPGASSPCRMQPAELFEMLVNFEAIQRLPEVGGSCGGR